VIPLRESAACGYIKIKKKIDKKGVVEMRATETKVQRAAFEDGVSKWLGTEDKIIANCDQVLSSTDNKLVRTIAGAIRADAVKHKEMLGEISEVMNGTVTLTPDEMATIDKLLEMYVELEKRPIEMAAHERTSGENFVIRELLTYILEDESKYSRFRDTFNDFKKKIYPYGVH